MAYLPNATGFETYVSPEQINEKFLGNRPLHVLALRPMELADLQHDDLFSSRILGFLRRFQSVWFDAKAAEDFAAKVLVPREKPPWCSGMDIPQPVVLALSLTQLKEMLTRLLPGAGLMVMDPFPDGTTRPDDSKAWAEEP